MTLKTDVESLLFALGRRATVEEIARYLRIRDQEKIVQVLEELKQDYYAKQGPIIIVKEDGSWKMTVRDDLLPIVRKVVSKTELPKGVMETLAIIAFKAPVLQSQIVKLRTNKAYDHLALLEDAHYITREKQGRTKLIKLAGKFFDYFDVPEADLKQRFGTVSALEQAIVEKEQEIEGAQAKKTEAQATHRQEEEKYKQDTAEKHRQIDAELAALPEVDLIDEEGHKERLEPYESTVYEPEEKKLGPGIEVVEEIEVYKTTKLKEPQPVQEKLAIPLAQRPVEELTPEQRAEVIRESLEPEEAKPEEEELTAPPEGTSKFKPEAVEYEAQKLARGMQSREGKGLFTEGMSKEMENEVEEKVSGITGIHEPKKSAEDAPEEHDHPPIEPESASDVHVSPEEGEKEERKQGGKDPHAHPGKEE